MLGLRIPLRNVSKNSRFQFISAVLGIGKLEMSVASYLSRFITEHEFQEIRECVNSIEFNVRADNCREIARRLRRIEDAVQIQIRMMNEKMGMMNETMLLVIEGQKVLSARLEEFIQVKKIWE